MNKENFINILQKYTKNELPRVSVEGLFDTYRQDLEKEIRQELKEESDRLKTSIKLRLKHYFNRIKSKINVIASNMLRDALIYILRKNYEIRKQVKDTVQLHDINKMLKSLDEVTDELHDLYDHELDTAVKKQLIEKWAGVTRLKLRKKLNK